MKIRVTVEPTDTPVTLDDIKTRLRISGNDRDSELAHMRAAAVDRVQRDAGVILLTQTRAIDLDCFPVGIERIYIREYPVTAITSIKYYDTDDTQQTLSSAKYTSDLVNSPARIHLVDGESWPVTNDDDRDSVVEVLYVAGYATPGAVPSVAKLAVLEAITQIDCAEDDCGCNWSSYDRLIRQLTFHPLGV